MNPRTLIEILTTAERLKDTTRHCYTSHGRYEYQRNVVYGVDKAAFFPYLTQLREELAKEP